MRLISVDRPGIGLSDPLPGRRLLDWADDVRELANALELRRFRVVGLSGGGLAPFSAERLAEEFERLTLDALLQPVRRAKSLPLAC